MACNAAAQSTYAPGRTEWGDPDFRGTWPMDRITEANIPLQRPEAMGERRQTSDEEFARRLEQAEHSDGAFAQDVDANGTAGLAQWLRSTPFGRRTSLIVDPPNGRLPPMTPQGQALFAAGRSSWVDKQPIDWVTDLDSYDRCITRGLPSAILPWPNNNGVRVFQSPGFVVLQLEVLGTQMALGLCREPLAHLAGKGALSFVGAAQKPEQPLRAVRHQAQRLDDLSRLLREYRHGPRAHREALRHVAKLER